MGKLIFGADDAGKGPVLGPMVVAGVVLDEDDFPKLKEAGVKDSKLLTPKQRATICKNIVKIVKAYKIILIPPQEIDSFVNSETTNLNWLEADKMAELINALQPDEAIIDCPSPNKTAFGLYLMKKLETKIPLKCEHKAERFLPVGAASILAKCARDAEVEKIQKRFKENIGSGYPADPITQKFLKENWDKHPELFRHSWAPYKAYSEGKKQKNINDF